MRCNDRIRGPRTMRGGGPGPAATRAAAPVGISLWTTGRVSCGNPLHNPPTAWDNSRSGGDKHGPIPRRASRAVHNSPIRVDNPRRFSTGCAPRAAPIQARIDGLSTNPHPLLRVRRNHPYTINIDMNKRDTAKLSTSDGTTVARRNPSRLGRFRMTGADRRGQTAWPGYLYPPTGICYNGEAISGIGRTK
jgi:hypothetical protein